MRQLGMNVRLGFRLLRRQPGSTLAAIAVLAVGVGATTAVYQFAREVLMRPLPVRDPERVVAVLYGAAAGLYRTHPYVDFVTYREHARTLEQLAASTSSDVVIEVDGRSETVSAAFVSPDYFALIGVHPAIGTSPAWSERPSASELMMVMSHACWRRLGGDRALVGRTVHVNRQPVAIAGVAPASFTGLELENTPDLWLPLAAYADVLELPAARRIALFSGRSNESFHVIGRLSGDATVGAAQAELRPLHGHSNGGARRSWAQEGSDIWVLPIESAQLLPPQRGPLIDFVTMLAIGSLLVLTVALLNGTGAMVLRWVERARELATRMALGATARDVARQLVMEATTVTLLGGLMAIVLAAWCANWFSTSPVVSLLQFRPASALRFDTVAFVLVLSLVLGCVIGGVPAWYMRRADLAAALRSARIGGRAFRLRRWRLPLTEAFLAAQIAISVVLLATATVLFVSLHRALSVDVGFANRDTYVATLEMAPSARGVSPQTVYADLLDRVARLPGVKSATMAATIPFGRRRMMRQVQLRPAADSRSVECTAVAPAYFSTLGIQIVKGRAIEESDGERSPPVAVINEAFASRYWGSETPLGMTFRMLAANGPSAELTVVGVARTGRYRELDEAPRPLFYLAARQHALSRSVHLIVQPLPGADIVKPAIQREVHRSLESIRLAELVTMDAHLDAKFARRRVALNLMVVAGCIALVVTLVGLASATAYAVNMRRTEIGVRMSIGASPAAVAGMFLRAGGRSIAGGMVVGYGALLLIRRLVSSLLFGIELDDPAVLVPIGLAVAIAAALACAVPARAATRIEPMDALRAE